LLVADVRPGFIALVAPLPMTMARSHTLAHLQVITSSAAPLTHTRAPHCRQRRRQRQLCWELNAFAFFIRLLNSERNGSPPLQNGNGTRKAPSAKLTKVQKSTQTEIKPSDKPQSKSNKQINKQRLFPEKESASES